MKILILICILLIGSITYAQEEEVERTAMCYASNYEKGIEVGKDYLCNLSFDSEGNPHLRMSHLNNADRATAEDFAGLHQLKEQVISEEFVM